VKFPGENTENPAPANYLRGGPVRSKRPALLGAPNVNKLLKLVKLIITIKVMKSTTCDELTWPQRRRNPKPVAVSSCQP
jgi:hypothetical protein